MSATNQATPPVKTKRADILAAATALQEKSAANAKKIETISKSPDYGGRNPGGLFGSNGPNVSRQVGERSYSFQKMAGFLRGQVKQDAAVEETQISQKLMSIYMAAGYSPHAGEHSYLIPLKVDYLPTHTTEAEKLATEIRQKMAFSVQPDELQYAVKNAGYSQKALGTLLETAGGSLVQGPQILEILDMQRNFESFSRAGATEIPMMPNGRAFISKLNVGATAGWIGEGGTITASQQTTGQMLLIAKKVFVLVPINNELFRFGMPGNEALIRNDMARQAGLTVDAANWFGTGGTQIKGLFTYPSQSAWVQGVDKWISYTASTTGTDGDTLEPQDIDKMVGSLPDEVDDPTFLMRRKLFTGISSRRATGATLGDGGGPFVTQRVLDISGRISQQLNGYRTAWSSNIPNNRVKASGTTLTCAACGNFAHWVIARMGVGEVVSNMYADTYFAADQTALRLIQQVDAGPRYLASFVLADQLVEG